MVKVVGILQGKIHNLQLDARVYNSLLTENFSILFF